MEMTAHDAITPHDLGVNAALTISCGVESEVPKRQHSITARYRSDVT